MTINLATGSATGGDATGDTLSNIENVIASAHDDVIDGDDATNFIYGLAGNDTLRGNGGADTLYGREGNDVFNGGPGDDFMIGGDVLISGPDNDQFEVFAGNDTVMDFNPKEDSLWLPGGTTITGTLINGDTVLTYPGGTLTLDSVNPGLGGLDVAKDYPWLDWITV